MAQGSSCHLAEAWKPWSSTGARVSVRGCEHAMAPPLLRPRADHEEEWCSLHPCVPKRFLVMLYMCLLPHSSALGHLTCLAVPPSRTCDGGAHGCYVTMVSTCSSMMWQFDHAPCTCKPKGIALAESPELVMTLLLQGRLEVLCLPIRIHWSPFVM